MLTVKTIANTWANQTLSEAQTNIHALGIKPGNNSQFYNLKQSTRTLRNKDVRIGFSVPTIVVNGVRKPYGIYVHKGVGKGTKAGEQGNTNRIEKPWLIPVIEKNLNRLAQNIAENISNEIINSMKIG